jgi:hypothetical protein
VEATVTTSSDVDPTRPYVFVSLFGMRVFAAWAVRIMALSKQRSIILLSGGEASWLLLNIRPGSSWESPSFV